MPLIELLRPEQRAWLRRLRRRIANRELDAPTRADINRKLLCPASTCPSRPAPAAASSGPKAPAASTATTAGTWLLKYAMNKAEVVITALLESAALEDDARYNADAPAQIPDAVPVLDDLSALGDPCLRW